MHSVEIKKHKNIEIRYGTLYLRFWRLEFRIMSPFKYFYGKKYSLAIISTGKIGGRKGFVLYFFPFALSYQVTTQH